jgi:hypothetical protein
MIESLPRPVDWKIRYCTIIDPEQQNDQVVTFGGGRVRKKGENEENLFNATM